jgi:zona occludens toxin (predicted ATPase)
MGLLSPVTVGGKDSGGNTEVISTTDGALHVRDVGANSGVNAAASVNVNAGVIADVDAAVAAATGLRLVGYSCRESAATAAAATFVIVNGATAAGGTGIAVVELAANASETVYFGDAGIDASNGLSIDHIAGTVDVNLFYKVIT